MTAHKKIGVAAVGALMAVLLMGTTWTTPRTWVFDETVTETILNTHVRDNLLYLYENQIAHAGSFRGLRMRTSDEITNSGTETTIKLLELEHAVMSDGTSSTDWDMEEASITSTGAGGRDTGAEEASTWYEIHGIRNPNTLERNLLLHKASQYIVDETQTTDNTWHNLGDVSGNAYLAQGFSVDNTARLHTVRVIMQKVGSPVGQLQMELRTDSSGSPASFATSRSQYVNGGLLSASANIEVLFVFRGSSADITSGTQYHLVISSDAPINGSDYFRIRYQNTDVYARGQIKNSSDGASWSGVTGDWDFTVISKSTATALTMPSGYTQSVLLGYVFNDASSNFIQFYANDKRVTFLENVSVASTSSATPELMNISGVTPPVICRSWWLAFLSPATGSRTLSIRPADTGAITTATSRTGGQVQFIASAVSGAEIGPIVNENFYAYITASGDTGSFVAGSYEW